MGAECYLPGHRYGRALFLGRFLAEALRLPRVNLLIADDVGLGKTVEAGLVARELLLRRRIDFIVASASADFVKNLARVLDEVSDEATK